MPAPDLERTYWCFISYRHADNRTEGRQWATWLHHELETYEVPEDLVGSQNERKDVIPSRIFPVFRDEDELAAGSHLTDSIEWALDNSMTMLVLCSRRALESSYVDAEIRTFKSRGGARSIFAAVIDGTPSAKTGEAGQCFPDPLLFEVGDDGKLHRDQPVSPLAADFRLPDGSEGWTSPEAYRQALVAEGGHSKTDIAGKVEAYAAQLQLAKLKIIAGILGVPLGQLTERDKEYQLRKAQLRAKKQRRLALAFAVIAVLAVAGGLVALWQRGVADTQRKLAQEQEGVARQEKERAEEQQGIAEQRKEEAEEQRGIAEENTKLASDRLAQSLYRMGIANLQEGKTAEGLAYLTAVLRANPAHLKAQDRLQFELANRHWLLPETIREAPDLSALDPAYLIDSLTLEGGSLIAQFRKRDSSYFPSAVTRRFSTRLGAVAPWKAEREVSRPLPKEQRIPSGEGQALYNCYRFDDGSVLGNIMTEANPGQWRLVFRDRASKDVPIRETGPKQPIIWRKPPIHPERRYYFGEPFLSPTGDWIGVVGTALPNNKTPYPERADWAERRVYISMIHRPSRRAWPPTPLPFSMDERAHGLRWMDERTFLWASMRDGSEVAYYSWWLAGQQHPALSTHPVRLTSPRDSAFAPDPEHEGILHRFSRNYVVSGRHLHPGRRPAFRESGPTGQAATERKQIPLSALKTESRGLRVEQRKLGTTRFEFLDAQTGEARVSFVPKYDDEATGRFVSGGRFLPGGSYFLITTHSAGAGAGWGDDFEVVDPETGLQAFPIIGGLASELDFGFNVARGAASFRPQLIPWGAAQSVSEDDKLVFIDTTPMVDDDKEQEAIRLRVSDSPAPAWLPDLTELLVGLRVRSNSTVTQLNMGELEEVATRFAEARGALKEPEIHTEWLRWFLAEPTQSPPESLPGECYPETRSRILVRDRIRIQTFEQLRYAINEIYARHGYPFADPAIRQEFLPWPWYQPEAGLSASDAEKRFSEIEKQNLKLLSKLREERKR